MFTGLVEETGKVQKLVRRAGSVTFTISAKKTLPGLHIDHSIAVNGVCLTVVKKISKGFVVQAVEETLKKSTLGMLVQHDRVNLERPLLPSSRMGGHFVLGHVDAEGRIIETKALGSSWTYRIKVPRKYSHHLIPVGSIAVDGISLTISKVFGDSFEVSIIPHTMEATIVDTWNRGKRVNLEFDVLGKFV